MSNLYVNIQEVFESLKGCDVILTIGNALRSDDGLGPYIASKLGPGENLTVINAGSNPENVIDDIVKLKPKNILIIDAADFKAEPGVVKLIDKEDIPETTLSTHTISLKIIAEILAHDTNAQINFLGVQAKSVELGEGMCDEVKSASSEIVEEIKRRFYYA
ncbi:MAG: hydrogenase maturation peptidase HycI [Candidatus Omnitrophica bacterium]|nr:hydrogenase maturation peptidase HycI [Candidatus Omnitrophota bacterium]